MLYSGTRKMSQCVRTRLSENVRDVGQNQVTSTLFAVILLIARIISGENLYPLLRY